MEPGKIGFREVKPYRRWQDASDRGSRKERRLEIGQYGITSMSWVRCLSWSTGMKASFWMRPDHTCSTIGEPRADFVSAIPKTMRGFSFATCACVLKSKMEPAKVRQSWQLWIIALARSMAVVMILLLSCMSLVSALSIPGSLQLAQNSNTTNLTRPIR